ncbi:CapA family protein [Patescibacteria group bacterium]|nr:CapA family protein [Patescibacteria group bacterium]
MIGVVRASSQVTITVAGDVMLARAVTQRMRQKDDFAYPFFHAYPFFSQTDLVWVNLESPFGQDCVTTEVGMVFCADSRAVESLIGSGVGLVSLANNHAFNQGQEGLEFTVRLLEENFIQASGLREPVYWEKNGLKFGFLAYNGVNPKVGAVSWADPEVVSDEVARLKKETDLVVVYFHWGQEYTSEPELGGASPYHPRDLAYQAIEAGADLVVGAHPHVVQPVEWYQGKLIVYSLGNFVFDQGWSAATQRGMVGRFTFDPQGLVMASYLPVFLVDFQPILVSALDNPWFRF